MKNKIKLRYYQENDLQFLHELLSDSETKKFFPFMYTTSIEQSDLRLKMRLMAQEGHSVDRFVIENKRKPVGEISGRIHKQHNELEMHIAIIIHPNHRGKGFAKTASLEFVSRMIKEHSNIKKFILEIARTNYSSQAVARKLEFRLDDKRSTDKENTEFWEKDREEF